METAVAGMRSGATPFGMAALLRRFVLALAGEGSQSAFHLALNLVLMRSLPVYDYGLFAIVFTLGSLALSYSHALVSIPAAVTLPRLRSAGAVDFQDVVFGSAATVFSAFAGLLAAAGLSLAGHSGALAGAAGAFVALWSLRNYCRTALFARRRAAPAARSDLAFAATGSAGLAILFLGREHLSDLLVPAFAVLAVANAAGIAAALLASPGRPRISLRRGVARRYLAIWRQVSWSLLGVTTTNVQAQFQTFLVAFLAGPAAYAPIAAALVLLAPLRLAVVALTLLVQPEFAAGIASGQGARVRRVLVGAAALVALMAMGYGACLWAGWDLVRARIFGPGFAEEPMGLITVLGWAIAFAYLAAAMPKALMEAAGRFQAVATATLASAGIGVAAVSGLLLTAGAAWSLAGVLAAEIVSLVLFWVAGLAVAARCGLPRPLPARG